MTDIFEKYDLVDVDETFPIPDLPDNGVILLVGSSGSGKSTILNHHMGNMKNYNFNDEPIWKNFSTPENAEKLLTACGLRTIPAWKRTFKNLSNGEAHRAEIALQLDNGNYFIDEFTSVVDRDTAKSLSFSMRKFVDSENIKRIVIVSCHRDIEEWLLPDVIYDTDLRQFVDRGLLCRPILKLKVEPVNSEKAWKLFGKYHYLNTKINKSSVSYCAFTEKGKPIAFTSIIAFPSGTIKNAYRGHRTVVLPEFQGLGIGNKLSELIAQNVIDSGGRFFSKTAHPAMGHHRDKSKLWRPTSKNHMKRSDYFINRKTKESKYKLKHAHRVCYSHEYIGIKED